MKIFHIWFCYKINPISFSDGNMSSFSLEILNFLGFIFGLAGIVMIFKSRLSLLKQNESKFINIGRTFDMKKETWDEYEIRQGKQLSKLILLSRIGITFTTAGLFLLFLSNSYENFYPLLYNNFLSYLNQFLTLPWFIPPYWRFTLQQ